MANFDWSMKYLLQNEGSDYADNPADKGGPTKFGITLSALSEWRTKHGFIQTSSHDVEGLTLGGAYALYQDDYWAPLCLDQIISSGAATAIFDCGVNMGIERAVSLAQQAVGATVDGKMGPNTIKAINYTFSIAFLRSLIPLIQNRYIEIVVNDPTQIVYLNGWLRRSQRLMSLMG